MEAKVPLVVDVDGTLLRGDSLHDAVTASLRAPRLALRALSALASGGRAAFKRVLASNPLADFASMPFNAAVEELARTRAEEGCQVVLASGADAHVVESIRERLPAGTIGIGSDGKTNLTGRAKAELLVARFGERGFDYVGNSRADVEPWQHARRSYLATTRRVGTPRWASALTFSAVLRDPRPHVARLWARQVRMHQWLKNLLVFLPLIAAHEFGNLGALAALTGAFFAFSAMASAVYLVNDSIDLSSDRNHARKRTRPLAAGWISPLAALTCAAACSTGAVALAWLIDPLFLIVLLTYAVLTTAYSFWLKRVALVDIVLLALLYMIRIVGGAVVAAIALSFWFTAVTLFLFLSLALLKRYAEAHEARLQDKKISGRGYSGDDVHAILALGVASGIAAVLFAATYIQSEAIVKAYPAPTVLWALIPVAFFWVANLWLKAGRGQMHDDPLVFALRDRASVVASAIVVLVFAVASLPAMATVLPAGILR